MACTGAPTSNALATFGRERSNSSATGSSSSARMAESRRNGRCTGKLSTPGVESRPQPLDHAAQLVGMARERLEGAAHVHEQLGVGVRHRSELRRGAARLHEEVVELRVRVREVLHHRLEVAEERSQVADQVVDGDAATRQRLAVALVHRAQVAAELGVLDAEEVVELGGLHRLGQRDGVAGRDRSSSCGPAPARCTSGRVPSGDGSERSCRPAAPPPSCRASASPPRSLAARTRRSVPSRRALPRRAGAPPPRLRASRPGAPRCRPRDSSRPVSPPAGRTRARTAGRRWRCRPGTRR